jgi:hypothetical protein
MLSERTPELWIRSPGGESSLHLLGHGPDWPAYFWAELEDAGLKCRARVSAVDPSGRKFSTVFREIDESWRGWEGERVWESPEGELELRFSMSATGRITVKVMLRDPYRWTARTELSLQSGDELSQLAKDAQAFQDLLENAA